ncbi:MAG: UDP-N-acetylmuramoyl-L-alanine--D-glutamate ligase [Leptospirales bacterium]|nr:UDP-N-acetylmuramoyl-L-alanine--D-glutamate ligase [Leptospirales bacterium]
MSAPYYSGRRALVSGAGGVSGQAAMALLLAEGAQVFGCDRNASLAAPPEISAQPGFGGIFSDQSSDLLDTLQIQIVVVSPGIPLSQPLFAEARRRQLELRGENELGFEAIQRRWSSSPLTIAVTGTDGKSTVTALLAHLIAAAGRSVVACGNYGLPLSQLALQPSVDALVVECSSFQLELNGIFHPQLAMLLNLAEDHLDRYDGMDGYLDAKLNVLSAMQPEDNFLAPAWILEKAVARFGAQAVQMQALLETAPAGFDFQGQRLLQREEFALSGVHNALNLANALGAIEALSRRGLLKADAAALRAAALCFQGLPHRMQRVAGPAWAEFINDSKATTVQATLAALASYPGRPLHLLLGGRAKGASFAPLAAADPLVRFYAYGEAGSQIAAALGLRRSFSGLESAFEAACQSAENEGSAARPVILLSPACASYDAFRSYSERGQRFEALVAARRRADQKQ